MFAHAFICPKCAAELRPKVVLPEGTRGANCPRCGTYVPFRPGGVGTAEPVGRLDSPAEGATTAPPGAPKPPASDTATALAGSGARDESTVDAQGRPRIGRPPAFPFLAPPQQPDEIGRLGTYRVLEELGRGGMGVVFRAEDTHLRRVVALKVMLPQHVTNPTDKARFVREARAQAAVEHDHVAKIYEVNEVRGAPYLTMPLLKGQNLAAALRANPKVPLAEALRIAREMAEGLAAAHEQNLVHRDIKPGNVWLEGARRRVKILDFGLARPVGTETGGSGAPVSPILGASTADLTYQGAVIGTPAYMSPEQGRGERLDGRSDLFSLGLVLYQMLAGRHPFRGENATALLIAIATDVPPLPSATNPEVPPALDELAMALLAKRPDGRPATAEAVVEQLRAIEARLTAPPVVAVPTAYRLAGAPPDPWADIDLTEEMTAPDRTEAADSAPEAPARAVPWALVGSVLGLVLVAGLVLAAVYSARPGPAPVAAPLASTDRVVEKKPSPPPPSEDRKAAEWVLNSGGKVMVWEGAGEPEPLDPLPVLEFADWYAHTRPAEREVTNPRDLPLPNRKFVVTRVHLRGCGPRVNDTGLEILKGLKHVVWVDLFETNITDAGLVALKGMTDLTLLNVQRTGVTDQGLQHLCGLTNLTALSLNDVAVTDDGLAALGALARLRNFHLTGTPITGTGAGHLRGLVALRELNLHKTPVTADGLREVAKLPALADLSLDSVPAVADDWLEPLCSVPTLKTLRLNGTKVTDDGLERLARSGQFTLLQLHRTAVTAGGVARAKKLSPHTRIEWDGD